MAAAAPKMSSPPQPTFTSPFARCVHFAGVTGVEPGVSCHLMPACGNLPPQCLLLPLKQHPIPSVSHYSCPLQRKCSYCDFPVIAVGQNQAQSGHWQVGGCWECCRTRVVCSSQLQLQPGRLVPAWAPPFRSLQRAPLQICGINTCMLLQDQMGAYVQLLLREVEASQRLNEGPLQSVFFGGGAFTGVAGLKPPFCAELC